jgi:hypothetical protein
VTYHRGVLVAKRERVNRGYMSRVLRLTLLASDIVEAILDGRQPGGMRLEDLLEKCSAEWGGPAGAARSCDLRLLVQPFPREESRRRKAAADAG